MHERARQVYGDSPARRLWTGLSRGLRCRCPGCGRSALFAGYVRVANACAVCGLEVGTYRADDAPPYFTIFIVGHVVIPGMLLLEQLVHPAHWVHLLVWLPLTLVLSFGLLPRVKGAVIGTQWALRITG